MSAKAIVMTSFIIGSFTGSYLPVLFGVGVFSFASIIMGAIGGAVGICVGYKIAFS